MSADGSEDDDIHIQGLKDYVFNQSDLASPEDHFAQVTLKKPLIVIHLQVTILIVQVKTI